jgi:hypothetical protein
MNTRTSSRNLSPALTGLAVGLIGVTGVLHLVQAPQDLNEVAFRGVLFIANSVLGLAAAYGIWRGSKTWAWLLGLLVAGGALGFYVISRSIGIPGWEDSIGEWFEPIGILSWLVEVGFVGLALMAFTRTHESQDLKEFATAQR